jgi:hypothetical protein
MSLRVGERQTIMELVGNLTCHPESGVRLRPALRRRLVHTDWLKQADNCCTAGEF